MIGWLLRFLDTARGRARARRWPADQAAGRRGEDLAHRFLERKGMIVVARNWRPSEGAGEIDLVARDGETLVFVEVKSRGTAEYGAPERNVSPEKRNALLRAGRKYAGRAGIPWERVRFDLVGVVFAEPPEITYFKDAFPLAPTL